MDKNKLSDYDEYKRSLKMRDLYRIFLKIAVSIEYSRDRIDKLISILDNIHYGKYIEVEDISDLTNFMNDIDIRRINHE